MKTLIPIIITVALGCVSHAQEPPFKPVPPPPPDDVVIVAQAPARAASPTPAAAPVPPGHPAININRDYAWNAPFKLGSSSSSSRRTLVIPKGEANPELLAHAEEDLNVMTLILEKALEQRSDEEGHKALGIDVFSSSSGIRNVLIEGHGAIFTLKTKTALVPPPAPKKEETKSKETTTSEWEEARTRLYGPSDIEKEIHKALGKVQMKFESSEEYDEQKLQRLKDSLTEALKSASNVRHLSGDQTVTVVVLSSSPINEVRKIVAETGRGGDRRRVEAYAKADREREISEVRAGSRLMLQAKKSDIDAYAKGKLTAEAFREKVKIQVY